MKFIIPAAVLLAAIFIFSYPAQAHPELTSNRKHWDYSSFERLNCIELRMKYPNMVHLFNTAVGDNHKLYHASRIIQLVSYAIEKTCWEDG